MEYFNKTQIVSINILNFEESKDWILLPIKTCDKIDFLLRHDIWKLNQTIPLYKHLFGETCYTEKTVQNELDENSEFFDNETKKVMYKPRVVISFSNGSYKISYFKQYQDALDYANTLMQLDKEYIQIN